MGSAKEYLRCPVEVRRRNTCCFCLNRQGGRKWVISATPLGIINENNLCETGFFVPFIDRLARYVVSVF